jgi:hypothetical protein
MSAALIAGLGISALASGAAMFESGRQARKNDRMLNKMFKETTSWRDRELNKDFLETGVAKSAITLLNRKAKKDNEAAGNNNAASGATTDQALANRGKINEGYSNAVTKIAGMGTQHKENIRRDADNRIMGIRHMQMNNNTQKAQSCMNLANNVSNLGSAGIEAFA